ncbi:UDP-glucose 4-epimerase GalE [Nostoc sphaeroides CCNUC1]|uniref:UDP-glucose 4-epimerase GalE n=1 Tax=Nostoc sphaeroides CCNUC1 TaxID=2653204 RepID=A0A5P8W910_9NOSO|nr:UDP-glucose 4-epimerase GalE [Nostoc sphaeroides CCNUC1]
MHFAAYIAVGESVTDPAKYYHFYLLLCEIKSPDSVKLTTKQFKLGV